MRGWVRDPHSGGMKIPAGIQERIKRRVLDFAEKNYRGRYIRLDIRFKGQFCYIDAYTEPQVPEGYSPLGSRETYEAMVERLRNTPVHLCRLRYFGDEESWSFAFFAYSSEKYEPSIFMNGTFFGTPEEAFETSAVYLTN